MKLHSIIALACLAALLLSACDSAGENDADNGAGSLSARVDGQGFDASLAVVAPNAGGTLSVTGSDNGGRQIMLAMKNVSSAGTYALDSFIGGPNASFARYTASPNPTDTYTTLAASAGTVEIKSLSSSRVEGTFSFEARNSVGQIIRISDGTFAADLQ